MLKNLVSLGQLNLFGLDLNDEGARHLAAVRSLKWVVISNDTAGDLPTLAPILNEAGIDFRIELPQGKRQQFPASAVPPFLRK
jgi:hypothetical protein